MKVVSLKGFGLYCWLETKYLGPVFVDLHVGVECIHL